MIMFFFFKQKTAYEMRISDWSSDVCSSDLRTRFPRVERHEHGADRERAPGADRPFGIVAHGDGDAVALADAKPVGQGSAKRARGAPRSLERQPLPLHPQQVPARKGVGRGTRVTVRLARGGRRTIQTKKKNTTGSR